MKKCFFAAAVLVLGAALLGCAKKDGDAASAPGPGVRRVDVVQVTTNPPFVFLNDRDELDGYEIAILREVDKLLPQYTFHYSALEFAAMPVALEAGSAQIAVCMLVRSEARKGKFIFPEQYHALAPINLVVRNDSGISSLEDLAGRSIISSPASYEYSMLLAWNAAHPGKEITLKIFDGNTGADNYNAILRGDVDSSLSYPQGFSVITGELGITGLTLTPPVMVEDVYYMLAREETQLRDDLDRALRELLADGTLGSISREYLGEDIFEKYTSLFNSQGTVH